LYFVLDVLLGAALIYAGWLFVVAHGVQCVVWIVVAISVHSVGYTALRRLNVVAPTRVI